MNDLPTALGKIFTDPIVWLSVLVIMLLSPRQKWIQAILMGIGSVIFLVFLFIFLQAAQDSGILPRCMGYCP